MPICNQKARQPLLPRRTNGVIHPCPFFRDAVNLVVPVMGLLFSAISFGQWLFYAYYLQRCQRSMLTIIPGQVNPLTPFCLRWSSPLLFGSRRFMVFWAVPSLLAAACLLVVYAVNYPLRCRSSAGLLSSPVAQVLANPVNNR